GSVWASAAGVGGSTHKGKGGGGSADLIDSQPVVTDMEAPGLARIVPSGAVMETISTGYIATEGPLWNRREEYLLWSDMAGDRIYQWKPGRGTSTFVDPSGHSNGLTYDREGRLLDRKSVV